MPPNCIDQGIPRQPEAFVAAPIEATPAAAAETAPAEKEAEKEDSEDDNMVRLPSTLTLYSALSVTLWVVGLRFV
jgi:hypothetical protein